MTLNFDVKEMQQVLLRLSLAERRGLSRRLEAFNLTAPQYMTLRALNRPEAEKINMSELAEAANQVAATMTGIIDRLEERNLVARQRDPNDRRAQRVILTPQGKSLLEEIDQQNLERLERVLVKLTKEERQTLLSLINHYLELASNEISEKPSE